MMKPRIVKKEKERKRLKGSEIKNTVQSICILSSRFNYQYLRTEWKGEHFMFM